MSPIPLEDFLGELSIRELTSRRVVRCECGLPVCSGWAALRVWNDGGPEDPLRAFEAEADFIGPLLDGGL